MNSYKRYGYLILAILFIGASATMGFTKVGPIVPVIIGGSALGGLICWLLTTFHRPADPQKIVPLYLLTIMFLMVHIIEEYVADFAPRMSATFGITFPEDTFVLVFAMVGFVIWIGGALLIRYRNPFGNFLAWFVFFGMVFGELTHFYFPFAETGHFHYFPGMWTATLPLIPAGFAMHHLFRHYWLGGRNETVR